MIAVRIQGKPFNIAIVQVYAPTTDAEETEVDQFYEGLQHLLELTPKNDVLTIIGDWNAKVGSQKITRITGKFGLGVQTEAVHILVEFWPPDEKEGLPGEEPNAGNNRWQKKKGTAEDEKWSKSEKKKIERLIMKLCLLVRLVWSECSSYCKLLSNRKMQPSKNKNLEYSEAFYRPSLAVQKTSAEIVNEARNALRTLRTQRPFTPREEQRKLFGSASSRTPENRPPSAFSLHASSFEAVESRPVPCARLSPLDHKPKLVSTATSNEEHHISSPKPPLDSKEIRKVSNARARLFRTASYGNLLPDKVFLPNASKRLSFKEHVSMDNVSRSNNERFSQKVTDQLNFKEDYPPLTYKEHDSKIVGEEVYPQMIHISPSLLSNQSDQVNMQENPLLYSGNTEWTKSAARSENLRANETEEEKNYWNMKILPILHELETEDNVESLCHACTILYQALEEGNMLGKQCKRRTLFLKTLYKLVDIASDPLGLKLAKIILGVIGLQL
ncbi:Armadillo repeat-containing protein 2 [Varanus komodoensis]|nr:Armadillo repeat-containing protein 2 [Varanus komodoensis]